MQQFILADFYKRFTIMWGGVGWGGGGGGLN